MSKLEIEFELTGLKFRITGERSDVSGALAQLQQQIAMLSQSAGNAASALGGNGAQPPNTDPAKPEPPTIDAAPKALTSGRGRARRGSGSAIRRSAEPIEFRHDPEKFGFPKEEWNTANKAMWLLYVLDLQTEHKEADAKVLAATFNKYFRQFGTILSHNVARDLGAAKSKTGYVNSDPTKDPETWYLLASGKKAIEALIANPSTAEEATNA